MTGQATGGDPEIGVCELREQGFRVLGDEQCCELACDGGACESCPCCCAGWCVAGHSGEIPRRDLTPDSDYRIWLNTAEDYNSVAKRLAEVEGVAGLDWGAPASFGCTADYGVISHSDLWISDMESDSDEVS